MLTQNTNVRGVACVLFEVVVLNTFLFVLLNAIVFLNVRFKESHFTFEHLKWA